MGNFKVENKSFKTPPEDSYFLDLIWIEEVQGDKGPYYRWHWLMADIESQKEWQGCRATSQTSLSPTLNNRFGAFLKAIQGGLEVDQIGSTEELCMSKLRIKAFIEHNKKTYEGEEVTFCNVTKLIEGSSKKGEGVGHEGSHERLKPVVNEYLKKIGKPLLKLEDKDEQKPHSSGGQSTGTTTAKQESAPKKQEIPW